MGNKLSRDLLSPRPTHDTVRFATIDSPLLKAKEVVNLTVIDVQSGSRAAFFVPKDLELRSIVTTFAKKVACSEQGLELKVEDEIIEPGETAKELGLKNGDRLEIVRRAPMNLDGSEKDESEKDVSEKDGSEEGASEKDGSESDVSKKDSSEKDGLPHGEYEERMRAIMGQRWSRKVKAANEVFGYV